MNDLPPIVILRLRNMTAIDATGLGAIQELADEVQSTGRTLLLCGARERPSQLMHQADFERHVGEENIVPSIADAIRRSNALYSSQYASDARWRA
jgi:sulfate permease, SulP family